MGKIITHNLLRFIILILLQVVLLKNIGYYNLAAPFPYILIILLLPIGIPNLALYVIGLTVGLAIDLFYDSSGIHAAACIVLCAFRIFFNSITIDADIKKSQITPNLAATGIKWFVSYTFLGTITHHLALFLIEVFSFQNLNITLLSTLMSSVFTFLLIFLISLLFYKRKSRILD